MAIPLDALLDFKKNSYQVVSAVMKRAQQLTDIRVAYTRTALEEQEEIPVVKNNYHDEEQEEDKAVSIAFQEVLEEKITYKTEEEI